MILTKKDVLLLSGTGQARAAPLKSLLYISSLALLNLWNGPVGRVGVRVVRTISGADAMPFYVGELVRFLWRNNSCASPYNSVQKLPAKIA